MDLLTHEFLIQSPVFSGTMLCLSALGHAKMMIYFSFQGGHFA